MDMDKEKYGCGHVMIESEDEKDTFCSPMVSSMDYTYYSGARGASE